MLQEIIKDITTIDCGIIAHQVNCRGKMGSGVAGALRKKYPSIFQPYFNVVKSHINSGETIEILGTISLVKVTNDLTIANMFTQYDYGYDGKLYTNYDAIKNAFCTLTRVNIKNKPIYIPYQYGSGLGGGDWNKVMSIIEEINPNIIVCKLENI